MNSETIKGCFGIGGMVAIYAIYSLGNPGADGMVFGTVAAIVGGLAGYGIAIKKAQKALRKP